MKYSIHDLIKIIETLRGPNGCPWDKKQTHLSIRENLIEETYELIDAINSNNQEHIKEELGDILLHILFHSQIEKENNHFTFDDVVDSIAHKLVRRHPHVFGTTTVHSVDEVKQNWEDIKAQEQNNKTRNALMDKVSKSLPALPKAMKILDIAYNEGFYWEKINHIWDKFDEEKKEFQEDINAKKNSVDLEEEFGDLLFVLLVIGKHYNIDSESALNKTNQKFIQRFNYLETTLKKENKTIHTTSIETLLQLWQKAKKG